MEDEHAGKLEASHDKLSDLDYILKVIKMFLTVRLSVTPYTAWCCALKELSDAIASFGSFGNSKDGMKRWHTGK